MQKQQQQSPHQLSLHSSPHQFSTLYSNSSQSHQLHRQPTLPLNLQPQQIQKQRKQQSSQPYPSPHHQLLQQQLQSHGPSLSSLAPLSSLPHPPIRRRKRSSAGAGRCHSCNTTETPEWRRGPNGARTLCNACGLVFAKIVKRRGGALTNNTSTMILTNPSSDYINNLGTIQNNNINNNNNTNSNDSNDSNSNGNLISPISASSDKEDQMKSMNIKLNGTEIESTLPVSSALDQPLNSKITQEQQVVTANQSLNDLPVQQSLETHQEQQKKPHGEEDNNNDNNNNMNNITLKLDSNMDHNGNETKSQEMDWINPNIDQNETPNNLEGGLHEQDVAAILADMNGSHSSSSYE